MGIHHINGTRFKNAVVAGAQRVIQMQERLNNINVFPVADSDTGTNMALTLQSVAEGAINAHDRRLAPISFVLAESALMGARGNSGAILAQFFQGLADSFEGKGRVGMETFSNAVRQAVYYSREAISDPREGTILTVMHDWASCIQAKWRSARDFNELLAVALKEASQSLQDTPKKLKVLAKAGVVDAGAQGFVNMLEGVSHFIETGKIEILDAGIKRQPATKANLEENTEDITYRFCTECFLRGKNLNRGLIRQDIENMGDSLIVAGSKTSVRIHIHTNEPDTMFERVARHGEIVTTKKEDMWAQHHDAYGQTQISDIGIVTDSSCSLPSEFFIKHKIRVVPLSVTFGEDSYLDRVTITNEEFYRLLETSPHFPKTSQPSPGDFVQTYQLAAENHTQILSVLISSVLSGTHQAGVAAQRQIKDSHVEVVDSKTLSTGLGLLLMIATEAIEAGCSLEEVKRRLEISRDYVESYVSMATVDFMIRGGRVSKARGFVAKLLRLMPVVGFLPGEKAQMVAKTRPGKPNRDKVLEIIRKRAEGRRNLRFIICHSNADESAQYLAEGLERDFGAKDVPRIPLSPVVGAHAGPGAAGISFIGFPPDVEAF